MSYLTYYVPAAVIFSVLISLVRKSINAERRRKEEETLRAIYSTGTVLYRGRVYCVREICDSGPYSAGKAAHKRYLIVCKRGEERVFRIPMEEAEPYAGAEAETWRPPSK